MSERLMPDQVTRVAMELGKAGTDPEALAEWAEDHAEDLVETALQLETERRRLELSNKHLTAGVTAGCQMVAALGKLLQAPVSRTRSRMKPANVVYRIAVKRTVQEPAALMIRSLCAAAACLEDDDPRVVEDRTAVLLDAYAELEAAVAAGADRKAAAGDEDGLLDASRKLHQAVKAGTDAVRRSRAGLEAGAGAELGVHPAVKKAVLDAVGKKAKGVRRRKKKNGGKG